MRSFKFLTLVMLGLLVSSSVSFAADDLTVKPFIRLYSSSDFATDQSKMDFEFSGLVIKKTFNDNFSAVVIPAIARKSIFIEASGTDDAGLKHDPLDLFIVGLYAQFKELYAGVGATIGMYVSPFYYMEEYYMPYRFIEKPLDYRMMLNNFSEMGLMLNRSFMDDALKVYLGYIAGVGFLNSEFFSSTLNDNVNAGVTRMMVSFFPWKNTDSMLKELSITFNIRATARVNARSSYNFLAGYKYAGLSVSAEYLGAYSTDASKKMQVGSFGANYDLYGPFQPLFRYDYSDQNGSVENYILGGINTKWYEGKYQAAITFGVKDTPHADASMKRILISTQASF